MSKSQKLTIVAILTTIFVDAGYVGAQSPSSEKEKYLVQMVTQNPQSDKFRYDYATYLYEQERFDQAFVQIGYVLKAKPTHKKAQALQMQITEVKSITDPAARRKKMQEQALVRFNETVSDLHALNAEMESALGPDLLNKAQDLKYERQKKLERQYKISEEVNPCNPIDRELFDFEITAFRYRRQGLINESIQMFKKGLEKK